MKANKLIPLLRRGDGSTLSLDFTAMSSLDSRFTFSRTSLGTYVGPDGYLYGADSSTSSQTIGNSGTKTFTLAATANVNRRYSVGDTVIAASGANNMSGTVTSYDPSTQALSFTASSSTGSGTFTSWSIGTRMARFDYDPTTLAPRGLLIEGSVVNIFPYSNAMTGGQYEYGVSNSLTTTFNNTETASPDGSNNSVKVVKASSNQTYTFIRNQVTPQTSGVQTASVWVKKPATSGSRYVGLRLTGAGFVPATPDKHLLFDLDTGTVVTGLTANGYYTNPTIVAYPNGWYRISITSGTMSTGSGAAYLSVCMSTPAVDGSEFNTLAAGTCFYMFGPQAEAGSGASSYIPTGSSTVQRAAESCSMTGTNFSSWFNASEGTVFSHHIANGTTGTTRFVGSLRESDINYIDVLRYPSTSFYPEQFVQSGGSLVAQLIDNGLTVATVRKSAVAFKANDFALSVNGRSVITDNSGAMPTVNPDTLWIGSYANLFHFNGTIASLKFWPTRLPNATLQSLTQ